MYFFPFKTALLPSIILLALCVSGQQVTVFAPGDGYPTVLKYYDGEKTQQIVIPDVTENPFIKCQGSDETFVIDLSFIGESLDNSSPADRDDVLSLIEPGVPLEGDLPTAIEYAKDGSFYAVAYQQSDNVIFYNAVTNDVLASVQVGRQPLDIKIGNDFAYVCCYKGQSLYIISLIDFSLSGYVPLDGHPCQVELSPVEDTAYLACATLTQGQFVKVDLKINQQIYFGAPGFHQYGWISSYGRTFYKFTKFVLSPDGDQFIAGRQGVPTIFNPHTSNIIKTLTIGRWCGAAYSTGGDTLYVYSNHDDTVKMYRYNAADLTVIDSIYTTATCWFGMADYSDLVFNGDSTKILVADSYNGRYCLFDFNTHSCQLVPAPDIIMDDPVYGSFDGEYAVSAAGMHLNFINFDNGNVINTYNIFPDLEPQLPLGVSPVTDKLLVGNLNFYEGEANYNETLYGFDFSNFNNLLVDTAIVCGQFPEADVPVEACFSADGKKLLVANLLTKNLSVINRTDYQTDTIISYSQMSGIKAVPGTNQALIYGKSTGTVRIISLDTYEVLAELPIPQVSEAFVTSDGQFAYLIEYIGGRFARINKIIIDGAASHVQHFTTTSGCPCRLEIFNREVSIKTTSALSPDEKLLLVGANDPDFGMVVNVIDAENLDLLASVPASSECIMDFAFTEDSKRVVAIGLNTSQVPIIYLDRENSFLENIVNINQESYSAAFNSIDGNFYVLGDKRYIHIINPITGEIISNQLINYDLNLKIRIDARGIPMVLTPDSLIYDRETYPMPGVSSQLMYDADNDLFIIPVPGPDLVCIFDPKVVGIRQISPGFENPITIFPNPATNIIIVHSSEEMTRVRICNSNGDEVFSGKLKDHQVAIPTFNMSSGIYFVAVETVQGRYSGKVVVR
jgi:DNA-binding beta-propeller fold protein YncE